MPDLDAINRYIQSRRRREGLERVTAIEANRWLAEAGLLRDEKYKLGKPLRDLLRAHKISGAWQDPPGSHGRWFIGPVRRQPSGPRRGDSQPKRPRESAGPLAPSSMARSDSAKRSTAETEQAVAAVFEDALRVTFSGQYSFRRVEGGEWGHCDRHAWFGDDVLLVLEVERGQHHPEGNVAKVWPWLRENPGKRFLLIHAYTADAVALNGSRDRVASWLAETMAKSLRGRFVYERRVVDLKQPVVERTGALRELLREIRA